MSDLGGIGAATLDFIGGLINSAGSLYSNNMSRKSVRHAQNRQFKFVREQTQKMIDLANSAHQREVKDLRAAGLNPILSAGGNGASVPTLSSVSADAPTISNPLAGLGEGLSSSAKSLQKFLSKEYSNHLDQQQADINLTNGQNLLTHNQNVDLADRHDAFDAERRAKEGALNAEFLRNKVDQVATQLELGVHNNVDRHGKWSVEIDNPSALSSAVDLAREGVRSAMKMKANENARAWLNTAGQAVNSASSLLGGTGRFVGGVLRRRKP